VAGFRRLAQVMSIESHFQIRHIKRQLVVLPVIGDENEKHQKL